MSRISLPTVNWLDFPDTGDPEPVWPLAQVLEGISAAGCQGVGIDDYSLRSFLLESTAGDLAATLARLGLRCTDVGILRVGEGDARGQAASLARLADELGARTCIAVLTAPLSANTLEDLGACADLLRAVGARMALEFAPYSPIATLTEASGACERVGWDRCGLLLDIWHFTRSGTRWGELRRLRSDQLALVHVSDAPEPVSGDLRHESRFRRLPPGAGTFPTSRFLQMLERIGYDGIVSVEVLSSELRAQPPEVGACRLVEALRRLVVA